MPENQKETSIFGELYAVDVSKKVKEKNGFSYLPWAAAWAEIKKRHPGATHHVYTQTMDNHYNQRPWHDDGRTGWVDVGVTVNNLEHRVSLAIMDHRNQPISADKITSANAHNSIMRCLTKACAMHGLGLNVYMGEDLPEDVIIVNGLQKTVFELVNKKFESCKNDPKDKAEAFKEKIKKLCVAAEKEANPDTPDELITGDPRNINDNVILERLKKQIMATRK